MKKVVLTFGLISGAVASLMMVLTIPFLDRIGFDHGMTIGYTTIVLSMLFVFFGVRSYRDNVAGGTITFGRAVAVGILIAIISSVCYVATWQVLYFNFMPDFADKYAAYAIESAKASGATAEAVEETARQMAAFKEMYDRPLFNAAITFVEPFPVGMIVALISAAVLRRKTPATPSAAPG